MPVEADGRVMLGFEDSLSLHSLLPGRLSSFGFSGTIAHGNFVVAKLCSRRLPSDLLQFAMYQTSLFRSAMLQVLVKLSVV